MLDLMKIRVVILVHTCSQVCVLIAGRVQSEGVAPA